jgi:exopolysaccharide production protein ExoQ
VLAGVGIASLLFELDDRQQKAWTIIKTLVIAYALFMTGSRSSLIRLPNLAFLAKVIMACCFIK